MPTWFRVRRILALIHATMTLPSWQTPAVLSANLSGRLTTRSQSSSCTPCAYIGCSDRLAMEDTDAMSSLPEQIMGYAEDKLDPTPIQGDDLVHRGDRAVSPRARRRSRTAHLDG